MEIKEISERDIWENFFLEKEEKTFLQSWNWGEVQKRMGNKIWRLGVYEGELLLLAVLALKITAKRGKFLLLQHCLGMPEILIDKLKNIARAERCSFLRVAPLLPKNEDNIRLFKNFGFKEAPMHASAYEATLKLDITMPEEVLISNMRKTTRYLIRQAEKDKNLEIVKSAKIEDIELFNQLNKTTAKSKLFVPFSAEFIKNEFEVFSRDNQALLFFGKYKGDLAASALIIFWSEIAFYHQAALHPRYHKIPIAYLLQWEAIKEAKKRGCRVYDFWGYVDPQKYPKHPWSGPSLFKMGFGGKVYQYVKTQDFPLSKKYWLTYIFEKLRKTKRGL